MNAIRSLVRCRQLSRSITTSPRSLDKTSSHFQDKDFEKKFAKFKETQKFFQIDDGVPVYLKRGASDKFIVSFMYVYLAVLLGMSAHTVKNIIYPPPPS